MALSPVRRARLDADLTLWDVFRKTKIQPTKLSMIERHVVEPRDDEKDRIARALKASVADLFPVADQAAEQPAGDAA